MREKLSEKLFIGFQKEYLLHDTEVTIHRVLMVHILTKLCTISKILETFFATQV